MRAGLRAGIISGTSGGGGGSISITNQNITDIVTAGYTVNSDGKIYDHNSILLETWNGTGDPSSDYQVRATLSSGNTPSGTLNTWLGLNISRSWSLSPSLGQIHSCVLTIEIRDAAAPNTVRDSASITITADNS